MAFTDDKVFDTSYTPDLPVIDEAATDPDGVTIATLLPEGIIYSFYPVDYALYTANWTGISLTVSSIGAAAGTWQYTTDGANWFDLDVGDVIVTGGNSATTEGSTISLRGGDAKGSGKGG